MESFNPPEQTEPLLQRLEVIGKHAAPALYNAAEMKRVPLKVLWWPIAKLQDGLGGKARFFTIAGIVGVAALIAALILIPTALRMEAKGQLLPVEISQVFAPREGIVQEIRVKPGEQVKTGAPAVYLYNDELKKELNKIIDDQHLAQAKEEGAKSAMRNAERGNKTDEIEINTAMKLARLQQDNCRQSLTALYQTYNADTTPVRRGFFLARVEDKDERKRPSGAVRWTVLNDDKRDQLLGRTVRPNEPLARVANLEGPWRAELKIPQRNIGQVLKAFTNPNMHRVDKEGKPYLDVDVLLASEGDRSYMGRLYREGIAGEAVPSKDEHSENEPVVTADVKLNLPDFPAESRVPENQFTTGLEVRAKIRCGDHSLGYAWFHGVWEWFYEKVIFFF
jgi:hypothetical protein